MSDEIDVRIAELQLKQEQEKTLQVSAENRAKKTVGFYNFVVGGILGGLIAYIGAYYQYAGLVEQARLEHENKGREIDLELARLSLTILSGEYQDEIDETLPARMFALNALERGTGVEIPEEDKDTWARTGITPAGDALKWADLGAIEKEVTRVTPRDWFGNTNQQIERDLRVQELITRDEIDLTNSTCVLGVGWFGFNTVPHCGPFAFVDEKTNETCIGLRLKPSDSEGFWTAVCGSLIPNDGSK
ncbi:MAG: hypothetical protein AB3N12_01495 [Ruegeria sp.]